MMFYKRLIKKIKKMIKSTPMALLGIEPRSNRNCCLEPQRFMMTTTLQHLDLLRQAGDPHNIDLFSDCPRFVVDRRGMMMLVCQYQTLFTDFTADVRTIYFEAELLVCITVLTLVDRCKPPGHKRFWDRSVYGQGVLGVQRSNHELRLTLEPAWEKTWQIQALPEYF